MELLADDVGSSIQAVQSVLNKLVDANDGSLAALVPLMPLILGFVDSADKFHSKTTQGDKWINFIDNLQHTPMDKWQEYASSFTVRLGDGSNFKMPSVNDTGEQKKKKKSSVLLS